MQHFTHHSYTQATPKQPNATHNIFEIQALSKHIYYLIINTKLINLTTTKSLIDLRFINLHLFCLNAKQNTQSKRQLNYKNPNKHIKQAHQDKNSPKPISK